MAYETNAALWCPTSNWFCTSIKGLAGVVDGTGSDTAGHKGPGRFVSQTRPMHDEFIGVPYDDGHELARESGERRAS
jgi:hypothetical protein